MPVRTAYRRYYRSQLLNATLPGGVLGDVHRGIDHGRSAGALGRGLRSVLWDRTSGQAVQVAMAVAALLLLPAAVRSDVGWLLLAVAAAVVAVAVALPARVRRAVAAELREVVAARAVLPRVVLASALAAAGHVVVFVVVARSVGVTAPLPELAALGLVVLVASALPLSVAGWGPREGAAAWIFGAAGLGTETGLSVAVAFGVVSLGGDAAWTADPRRGYSSCDPVSGSRPRGGRAWLTVPTPCSAAACRWTATSAARPTSGCCSPTTPTSTGSTRCGPAATRSWSARPRSGRTTPGCSSGRPAGARARAAAGLPTSPAKVTVTARGDLDPLANFFTAGDSEKLVYCSTDAVTSARGRLGPVATVIDAGHAPRRLRRVGEDLHDRGVRRLMVEGGGTMHTQFLTGGLADELQLVVAPFFVGDSRARRFVDDGRFPWCPDHRAHLVETRAIGDVVLLRYALSDRFDGLSGDRAPRSRIRTELTIPLRLARVLDGRSGVHVRRPASTAASTWRSGSARAPRRCDGVPADEERRRWCGCTASASPATCSAASAATAAPSCTSRWPGSPTTGGYLLYLRQEGRGIGLYEKLDAYTLQDTGLDTYQANLALGHDADERDYTVAAQMLRALGIGRLRLLTNNPDKEAQLVAAGIVVTERVPTGVHVSPANAAYLAAKADLGAHTLDVALLREGG